MIPSSIKCPEAADLPSGYGKSLAAAPICSRQAFFYPAVLISDVSASCVFRFLCVSLPHTAARPLGNRRPVKAGIEGIEVPAVQTVLEAAQGFTESLEMNDLPFPEEADGIAHVRFLHQTQDVVVGGAGFLLWGDLVSTTYTKI